MKKNRNQTGFYCHHQWKAGDILYIQKTTTDTYTLKDENYIGLKEEV